MIFDALIEGRLLPFKRLVSESVCMDLLFVIGKSYFNVVNHPTHLVEGKLCGGVFSDVEPISPAITNDAAGEENVRFGILKSMFRAVSSK